MQSKISIDLNWDNKPVVKIKKFLTPDVRDKLVHQFLHVSPFFKISKDFDPGIGAETPFDGIEVELETVHPTKTKELIQYIEEWRKKNHLLIEKKLGDGTTTFHQDSCVEIKKDVVKNTKFLHSSCPSFLLNTKTLEIVVEYHQPDEYGFRKEEEEIEEEISVFMKYYNFKSIAHFMQESQKYDCVILLNGMKSFTFVSNDSVESTGVTVYGFLYKK